MTLRLLISLSLLLLLAWQKAGAQLAPADDFFNSGAQLFITNNIPAALERVETGRKLYPDDDKLKKLEQLLKQQQQQQQQQSQQNQQQNQQSQSQQNQSQQQQSQSQNSKDQQSQQQQSQKSQDGQKKDPAQKQQPASGAKPDSGEKKDDQNQQAQPAAPGQMTPEDAKRLLDSQKGNEQVLPMKPMQKPQDGMHPVKDW